MASLLAEGTHHPHAGQRLLEVGGDDRDLLARQPVGRRGRDAEDDAADREHREAQEGDQRQARIESDQDPDRPDQGERGGEQGDHAVGDQLVERLHVVRDPRDHHAGLVALVEADRIAPGTGSQ